jgi:probable phosphoglycerate mutase
MELILVRHGLPERVESADGTPADPPLSAQGHAQAERVASWLAGEPLQRIYTSPLRRARETAVPLASRLGKEPVIEPGVAEFDQNASLYVPLEELKRTDYPRWRALMESNWAEYFDPEQFEAIVTSAIERIIADNAGGRVVIFCHGGVINFWAAHVLQTPRKLFFAPEYTSIHRFMASSAGHRSLVSLNETHHLRNA